MSDAVRAPGPGAAPDHLLYLHGFRSSPRSTKAERLHSWLAAHRPGLVWDCPQLPPSPLAAMALIDARLATWPRERFAVAGSSLGGFYATVAAERWGCPAVLLNPAVDPARDLAAHVGAQTAWHDPDERFFCQPGFVGELRAMTPPLITRPQRYFAVIAKGDEVIDWREMVARYAGATVRLLDGSDHALSDFDDHLPFVLKALKLCD
jgi:predicted esterase YcpF (UPF0227 family)